MKVILLVCCAVFCAVHMQAQVTKDPDLALHMERKGEGNKQSLEIKSMIYKPGSYSVFIWFTELENANQPRKVLRVVKGSGQVLNITPRDPNRAFNCRYTYSYTPGYEPKKIDSAFVYRLPYSVHRTEPVRASYLYNVHDRYFNASHNRNWASLQFSLAKGDTVFAARKGRVIRIEDGFEPMDREEGVSYTSSRNAVTIEHGDGTIGIYSVFEKGSFMVSEDDMVYPGTPLGICGCQSQKMEDYQVRLSIHYPVVNPEYNPESKMTPFLYVYYHPVFATDQGDIKLVSSEKYQALSSPELVRKEMTKKELKKYSTY